MHQLIVILIAVLFIPVLLKFKVPVGPTLMIMGAAAGLLGGLSIPTVGMAFANVFLVPSTLSSVFVVVEVGMLSSLMMSSGLLERMDQAVRKLIPNTKVVLCIMPALIGALQAPGGASLSAPIANKLGKELGLTPAQRANINTICRHFLVLFTPFAVNLLVVQSVAPQVNILTLGAYNFGFVLLMQICGIWLMLHGVKNVQLPAVPAGEKPAALKEFLITFSPVILIFRRSRG